jgi:hypothetical protein
VKLKIPALLISCFLMGCNEERPSTVVIENGKMRIYRVVKRTNPLLGQYEYWTRDNSSSGWCFVTDEAYKVGDVLEIRPSKPATPEKNEPNP